MGRTRKSPRPIPPLQDIGFADTDAVRAHLRARRSGAVSPHPLHKASTAAGSQGTASRRLLPLLAFSGLALTILAARSVLGFAPAKGGRSGRVESSKAQRSAAFLGSVSPEEIEAAKLLSAHEAAQLLRNLPRRKRPGQLRHPQQPNYAEVRHTLPDQGGSATKQSRPSSGSDSFQSASLALRSLPRPRLVAPVKPVPTSRLADALERIAAGIRAHRLSETEE